MLAEFGIDADEDVAPVSSQQDDMADELLAEFGIDADEIAEQPDADFDSDDNKQDAQENTSELEAIPDNQTVDNDLADDLLAEFGIDTREANTDKNTSELEAIPDNQTVDNDLADDLLAEFGIDTDDLTTSKDDPLPDDAVSRDTQSENLDPEPDIPSQEDEKPREFAIDKMSEDDYQTLLDELDFDLSPASLDGSSGSSDQTELASSTNATKPDEQLDDIDALLAQHAPQAETKTQEDKVATDTAPDDIDMLLDQYSPEAAEPKSDPSNISNVATTAATDQSDVATANPEKNVNENLQAEPFNGSHDVTTSSDDFAMDDDDEYIDETSEDDSIDSSETPLSELADKLEPESADFDFDLDLDEEQTLVSNTNDIESSEPSSSDDEFTLELELDDVDFELDMEDESADVAELTEENAVDMSRSELDPKTEEKKTISSDDSLELSADEMTFEPDADANEPSAELMEPALAPVSGELENLGDDNDPKLSPGDDPSEMPDELEVAVDDLNSDDVEATDTPADNFKPELDQEPVIDELEAAAEALMAEDDEPDDVAYESDDDELATQESDNAAQLTSSLEPQLSNDDDDDYIDDSVLDAALREFEEADLNSTLPDEVAADREPTESKSEVSQIIDPQDIKTEPDVESNLLGSELEDVPGLGDWLGETNTMSQNDVKPLQSEVGPIEEWLEDIENVGDDSDSLADAIENFEDTPTDVLPPLDDLAFSSDDDGMDEGGDPELDAMLNSVEDELAGATEDENDSAIADELDTLDDEIEGSDTLADISFDALLNSIEEPEEVEAPSIVSADEATLDNPDLDLGALLDDDAVSDFSGDTAQQQSRDDFTDVEDLLTESLEAETRSGQQQDLNLDALLSDYADPEGDVDTLDVDLDSGNSAQLDLARAYIEINDLEAAKELLNKLKTEGSPEELAEVDELLKQLN